MVWRGIRTAGILLSAGIWAATGQGAHAAVQSETIDILRAGCDAQVSVPANATPEARLDAHLRDQSRTDPLCLLMYGDWVKAAADTSPQVRTRVVELYAVALARAMTADFVCMPIDPEEPHIVAFRVGSTLSQARRDLALGKVANRHELAAALKAVIATPERYTALPDRLMGCDERHVTPARTANVTARLQHLVASLPDARTVGIHEATTRVADAGVDITFVLEPSGAGRSADWSRQEIVVTKDGAEHRIWTGGEGMSDWGGRMNLYLTPEKTIGVIRGREAFALSPVDFSPVRTGLAPDGWRYLGAFDWRSDPPSPDQPGPPRPRLAFLAETDLAECLQAPEPTTGQAAVPAFRAAKWSDCAAGAEAVARADEAKWLTAVNADRPQTSWRQDGPVRIATVGNTVGKVTYGGIGLSPRGDRYTAHVTDAYLGQGNFLFDIATGAALARFESGDLRFSPDGRQVFEVVRSHREKGGTKLIVRDATSGQIVSQYRLPVGIKGQIDASGRVFAHFDDEVLTLTNSHTGVEALRLEAVDEYALSIDGTRLIAIGPEQQATLYDTATGAVVAVLPGKADTYQHSKTSEYMYTEDSEAGLLRVFDLRTGAQLWTLKVEPVTTIFVLASEAKIALTMSFGGPDRKPFPTARDIRTGKVLHTFDTNFRMADINSRLMVVDVEDAGTVVWDLATFQPRLKLPYRMRGHSGGLGSPAAISDDSRFVALLSNDDNAALELWDTVKGTKVWTGAPEERIYPNGTRGKTGYAEPVFSADGRFMVVQINLTHRIIDLSSLTR